MSNRNIQQSVEAILEDVEEFLTSDDMCDPVAYCKQHHAYGKRLSETSCPLATALRMKFPPIWKFRVGDLDVAVARNVHAVNYAAHVELPDHVSKFVKNFDAGCYPDLEVLE